MPPALRVTQWSPFTTPAATTEQLSAGHKLLALVTAPCRMPTPPLRCAAAAPGGHGVCDHSPVASPEVISYDYRRCRSCGLGELLNGARRMEVGSRLPRREACGRELVRGARLPAPVPGFHRPSNLDGNLSMEGRRVDLRNRFQSSRRSPADDVLSPGARAGVSARRSPSERLPAHRKNPTPELRRCPRAANTALARRPGRFLSSPRRMDYPRERGAVRGGT